MNRLLLLKLDFIPKQAINPFIKSKTSSIAAQEAIPILKDSKKILTSRKVFPNEVPVLKGTLEADEAVIGGVRKVSSSIKPSKKGNAHFQPAKKEVLNNYFDNEKSIDPRQENLEEIVSNYVAKDAAKDRVKAKEHAELVKAYEEDATSPFYSYFDEEDFEIIKNPISK